MNLRSRLLGAVKSLLLNDQQASPDEKLTTTASALCLACGTPSLKCGASFLTEEKIAQQANFMAKWMVLARDEHRYVEQSVYCCPACGHIFIDPILSDEDTLAIIFKSCGLTCSKSVDFEPVYFDGEVDVWSRAVRIPSLTACIESHVEWQTRHVLDIGAHGGTISLGLPFPEETSIDLLQCENAKAVNPPRSNIRQFRGLLSEFCSRVTGSYVADVLLALHVLEHAESPIQFLTDASGLMSDSSILIVEVPYEIPVAKSIATDQLFEIPHNSFFTPWSIRELFRTSALEIISLELLDHFHTGHGTIPYPVIRVVARRRKGGTVAEPRMPHQNFARTLDVLCGNLGGSLAYIGNVSFAVFVKGDDEVQIARLFERAPNFSGIVKAGDALPESSNGRYLLTLSEPARSMASSLYGHLPMTIL